MHVPATYLPALFSLSAMLIWGVSDFSGGLGARRANAFLFTAVVHLSGVVMMFAVARISNAPFPPRPSVWWAFAAGCVGGIALALFYRALASGKMGLTAPIAAVIGAGIPTIVTTFVEGFPGYRHALGFVLAGVGVWLISRTEEGSGRPEGLGLAVIAGKRISDVGGLDFTIWVVDRNQHLCSSGAAGRKTSGCGAGYRPFYRNYGYQRERLVRGRSAFGTARCCSGAEFAVSGGNSPPRADISARAL